MKLIYFTFCCLLLISCGQSEGPCGGGGYGGNCYSYKLAEVKLDSNNQWIPNITEHKTDSFYNADANLTMAMAVSVKTIQTYKIDLLRKVALGICGRSNTCYDYGIAPFEEIKYTSNFNNVFNFTIKRTKEKYNYVSDSSKLNLDSFSRLKDIMEITWGISIDNRFYPNVVKYQDTTNQLFHKQIVLNQTTYDSVFEVTRHIDPNFIVPHGIYYSKTLGLLGFYLTNKKEVWLKKP